ncbi:hypothetical protein T11_14476 [Trichinella zimbabwensis]|uniref:Uncharacterized protein n=1 Tax=Trichinella zimbabwensis TaxID=268475 RepID=A0A0V1GEI8_9BILA|nr:hypothetical protein T11_14476 [Trichinella zimbabwensis]
MLSTNLLCDNQCSNYVMPLQLHQSPITITNLNVLSGIAERNNGVLITYMLYKWSRDFRKPAYKAGKRAKRERTNGILL